MYDKVFIEPAIYTYLIKSNNNHMFVSNQLARILKNEFKAPKI